MVWLVVSSQLQFNQIEATASKLQNNVRISGYVIWGSEGRAYFRYQWTDVGIHRERQNDGIRAAAESPLRSNCKSHSVRSSDIQWHRILFFDPVSLSPSALLEKLMRS